MTESTQVADRIGIVELGEICARMRTRSLDLFELLGGWVADAADGELQRLWAAAAHRHAWHAELWDARLPAIPPVTPDTDDRSSQFDGSDRVAYYRGALDQLDDDIRQIRLRVDCELDPSTCRTVDLVAGDLADLGARLSDC